ncbi:hypothetical protein HPB52_021595 [Rhipicephalus sanguineus]|uniref:CCHC-type domain-containing protein n=1 Tax=Rhipicephalus sanguineus TaxID=34632 RepID=A0A9D4T687_RHISA|nr:hypothetical protein HPB52_021595 [Rhipicephalus sanguineus]
MEVLVAGQDISPEEVTAESGWLTARSRRPTRGTDNSIPIDESPQAPSNKPRSRARQRVKAQVLKAGRMPPLPTEDIKIVIRPKGALHITKIGSPVVTTAILQAAELTEEESLEDTICPNMQQNIVVVSTPDPDHADRYARIRSIQVNGVTHEVNAYETAAEHTTKGVIRGIPLTETPQQIHNNIVTARNPTALAAKRIASTTTVIIAFDGPDVPYQVHYEPTLLPCSLYRKQIDICYQCGRLEHRMDVCPYPNNKICRGCGARNPPADHSCDPKCCLCGGPHLTADKSCTARYKTPYVIRKRIGERRATSQAIDQAAGPSTLDTKARSRSRNQDKGRRSRSRTSSRSRKQRSRSRSASTSGSKSTYNTKVSFAEKLKGTSPKGRNTNNTQAAPPPPLPDNPEIAQLKRENAILRDLLTKLTQEVRALKETQTLTPTPTAQNAPAPSQEAPLPPAPKRRALQDGATGQVRSEVKDMLISLQTTMSTFQQALDSIQHALTGIVQRVTNLETHILTPSSHAAPVCHPCGTPMATSLISHHGPH